MPSQVYTHSKVIAQEHMVRISHNRYTHISTHQVYSWLQVCGAINAAKDSISFMVTPKGGGERKRMTVREIIEDGNCEGYLYLTDSLEDVRAQPARAHTISQKGMRSTCLHVWVRVPVDDSWQRRYERPGPARVSRTTDTEKAINPCCFLNQGQEPVPPPGAARHLPRRW